VLVTLCLLATGLVFGTPGVVAVLAAAAAFLIMHRLLIRSLGGTTGDTAGAMVELIETAVLLAVAAQNSAAR
jgi:adenosylcobinamide-GDP ribazoletransferase